MKMLTVALTLALAYIDVAFSQTPGDDFRRRPVAVSTRIQVVAEIDPSSVKVGAPVVIKIRSRNVSLRTVRIGDSDPSVDFEVVVTDAAGKEPPRTEFGKKLFRMEVPIFRSSTVDLEPGKDIEHRIDIAHVYDLTNPGTYYARVALHAVFPDLSTPGRTSSIYDPNQPVEKAFSNPIQFTLVE